MSNTPRSSLLALPPELRNWIYELALQVNGTILYGTSSTREDSTPSGEDLEIDELYVQHGKGTPGLLLTCKQVHREATTVYYSINSFRIMAMDKDGSMPHTAQHCLNPLNSFIETIGPVNASSLTNIDVFLGNAQWPYHKHRAFASFETFRAFQSWHLAHPKRGLQVTFLCMAHIYYAAIFNPTKLTAVSTIRMEDFENSCKHMAEVEISRQVARKGDMTEAAAAGNFSVSRYAEILGRLGKVGVQDVRRGERRKGDADRG